MWVAQHYPVSRPRSFISSGGLGTMGFGTGAAIGAQLAEPGRPTALDAAFARGKAAVIDCLIGRDEAVLPIVPP